jgi:hypothetical protein
VKEGWADPSSSPSRRTDRAPGSFHHEEIPSDPACAAWDEPGYVDPDLSHAGLPLGARYWQGLAKRCSPRRAPGDRAMSPEWVTEITEAGDAQEPVTETDPLREYVIREKETERLWWRPSMLPG